MVERQEHRIDEPGYDAIELPTHIEIVRGFFGGHETAVDVRYATAGRTQHVEAAFETIEQLTAMRRPPESFAKLLPRSSMNAGGKIARDGE